MKLLSLFKQSFKLPELLGVTPEAEERRNELALAATKVTSVATADEQVLAIDCARDIQTYLKATQDAGLVFRRPIIAFNQLIKRTEDDHLAPLLAEKERLEGMDKAFRQREQLRIAEIERKRQEEYERKEKERLAELKRLTDEQALREREAKRVQDEIDRKVREAKEAAERLTGEAKNKKQREAAEKARLEAVASERAAQAESERQEAVLRALRDADAATAAASEMAVQDVLRAPLPQVFKPVGASMRQTLKFEVLDVHKVYAHRKELVKLEVKAQAVQSVCVAKPGANVAAKDTESVLGLALWWEDAVVTRKR